MVILGRNPSQILGHWFDTHTQYNSSIQFNYIYTTMYPTCSLKGEGSELNQEIVGMEMNNFLKSKYLT